MKTQLVLLFALLAVGCESTAAENKTFPAHILILRHAEKPPAEAGEVGLNAKGKERAAKLHELFEKSDERTEPFPKPDFLFAAAVSKMSRRSIETVQPLGKQLKLPVNEKFDSDEFKKLSNELFHKSKYAGKTVLICWKHHAIPALAEALGATNAPKDWKDSVFDRVWQIDFADGQATFRDLPQKLIFPEPR